MGFYDDTPDLMDAEVKSEEGFYGAAGPAPKPTEEKKPTLSFKWWEWAIIAVEVGLVTYTVLVLLRIAPLF